MIGPKIFIKQFEHSRLQNVIAITFYAGTAVFLMTSIQEFIAPASDNLADRWVPLVFSGICLFFAVNYSLGWGFQVDLENKIYRKVYFIGNLKVGKWRKFQSVDYISVFKSPEEIYKVNLWYDSNRHFQIADYPDLETAMEDGEKIALRMDIGLLDASDPADSKWVNITQPGLSANK